MGSVFLRGSAWVGEYRDLGIIKRKALGNKKIITKTMAREMLKKIEQKVKLGQYDMLDATIPTLKEFSEDYLKYIRYIKRNRSWKDTIYHLRSLKSTLGDKKLSEITSGNIDDYKLTRLLKVKPASVNRELACLSHLFNYAKREKRFFAENPVSISKLLPENNQVERILTLEEETKLLILCNPYLKPIIVTALQTGLRKNEILTLKWSNVDLDNNVITLDHTNTKNKKTRRVPINSVLRKLLLEQKSKYRGYDNITNIQKYKKDKEEKQNYVFLSAAEKPYKRHDSIKGAFERSCKKAGINGLRFHDLRHTVATRMIEAGASIVAVSRILGHADLKTTMRYAHPENSLKEAIELLTNKFSQPVTDKTTDIGGTDN